MSAMLFLRKKVKLNATNDQIVDLFMGIAAGDVSRRKIEQIFSQWIVC